MKWRTPAGPLIHEHRLIERVLTLIGSQRESISEGGAVDVGLLRTALDFVRSYADECHHGKEEVILFKVLSEKDMSPELARMMDGLVEDHRHGRELVGRWSDSLDRFEAGDKSALSAMTEAFEGLAELYPRHIYTEDHEFFVPAVAYLSEAEQQQMLDDYEAYDATLIHKHYVDVVERLENASAPPSGAR